MLIDYGKEMVPAFNGSVNSDCRINHPYFDVISYDATNGDDLKMISKRVGADLIISPQTCAWMMKLYMGSANKTTVHEVPGPRRFFGDAMNGINKKEHVTMKQATQLFLYASFRGGRFAKTKTTVQPLCI